MKKGLLIGLAALVLSANVFAAKIVQLKGSDTMVNLNQSMVEEFMKQEKGARVAVTGGGSGTGLAALVNKTADVAAASRPIETKEIDAAKKNGVAPKEYTVAYDAITLIINKNNPVANLTQTQLRAIYLGEIKNWKEVGGADKAIVLLSRDSNSGTHVYFKEHVLRKGNAKGPEEYMAGTLFMPSTQAIVNEVAKNDAAIGYVGLGYIEDNIKTIKIDGIVSNVDNVKNKTYPISRGLYWYTNGEPKDTAKKLVDYAFSQQGQKIVVREGFVPIK